MNCALTLARYNLLAGTWQLPRDGGPAAGPFC
jgi:hypothetical protein